MRVFSILSAVCMLIPVQGSAQVSGHAWDVSGREHFIERIYGFKIENGSGYIEVEIDGERKWLSGVSRADFSRPLIPEQAESEVRASTPFVRILPRTEAWEQGFTVITRATPDGERELATVEHAIDGDTLQLEDGRKVRLIGVDTPETVHPSQPVEYFGKEASAFTSQAVKGRRLL